MKKSINKTKIKRKNAKNGDEQLTDALKRVAFGYSLEEVTEEYSVEDGEVKLTKRRKTHKDVPPDLKAVKMLLDGAENGLSLAQMTDEELEKEKQRLLNLLKEQEI